MFGNTYGIKYCPSNCNCSSEFWSTCEILYCDDNLDLVTPFLTIIGRLCPRQYDMMRDLLIYINNYSIAIACLWIIASEYSVFFIINEYIFNKKNLINFLNIYFFLKISDTEYRKLLSDHMNMSMKNILIRIIMDLIILKILKQHPLVLQKKILNLGQRHIQPLKLSLQKKIYKIVTLQI